LISSLFAAVATFLLVPFVFYACCLIAIAIIILGLDSSPDNRNGGWGWSFFGVLIAGTLASIKFDIGFSDLIQHPMLAVYGLVGYFAIGVVWSFAKWYFHLDNIRDKYVSLKAEFIEKNKVKDTFLNLVTPEDNPTDEELHAFQTARGYVTKFWTRVDREMTTYHDFSDHDIVTDTSNIVKAIKPLASKHKSSITQWIAFWPVSFIWTMINDPVRKIANWIFTHIKSTFQRMSDAMFAGV